MASPFKKCRYRGPSGTLLAFLPRKGHPSPSWLQMVVSSFSCSGVPTGDLNPIYNVPMLGTHKTHHPTTRSLSVSMTSRNYNINPVIHARPRS
jgi:hypothetical protein